MKFIVPILAAVSQALHIDLAHISEYTGGVGDFQKDFADAVDSNEKFIALIIAGNGADGTSWCPDTVAAKPFFDQVVSEAQKIGRTVLTGTVTP